MKTKRRIRNSVTVLLQAKIYARFCYNLKKRRARLKNRKQLNTRRNELCREKKKLGAGRACC